MARMTIDELSRRSGVTTRNIRAYQERGIVPPPEIVGRTGYYDERHAARLEVVGRLVAKGYSLAAIAELLSTWEEGRSLADVLGFEEAIVGPYDDDGPVTLDAHGFDALLGSPGDAVIERVVALGLAQRVEDGWLLPHPGLVEVGRTLVDAGFPIEAVLDEAERLRDDANTTARHFVELWRLYVLEPYRQAGLPPEDLQRIAELTRRLRSIPGLVASAMTAQAMARETDRRLAEALESMSTGPAGAHVRSPADETSG